MPSGPISEEVARRVRVKLRAVGRTDEQIDASIGRVDAQTRISHGLPPAAKKTVTTPALSPALAESGPEERVTAKAVMESPAPEPSTAPETVKKPVTEAPPTEATSDNSSQPTAQSAYEHEMEAQKERRWETGLRGLAEIPFYRKINQYLTGEESQAFAESSTRELWNDAMSDLGKDEFRVMMEGADTAQERAARVRDHRAKKLGITPTIMYRQSVDGPVLHAHAMREQAKKYEYSRLQGAHPSQTVEEREALHTKSYEFADKEVALMLAAPTGQRYIVVDPDEYAQEMVDARGVLAPIEAIFSPQTSDLVRTGGRVSARDFRTRGTLGPTLEVSLSTMVGAAWATVPEGEEWSAVKEAAGLLFKPSELVEAWSSPEYTKQILAGETMLEQYDRPGRAMAQALGMDYSTGFAAWSGVHTGLFMLFEPDVFVLGLGAGKGLKAVKIASKLGKMARVGEKLDDLLKLGRIEQLMASGGLGDAISKFDRVTHDMLAGAVMGKVGKNRGVGAITRTLQSIQRKAEEAEKTLTRFLHNHSDLTQKQIDAMDEYQVVKGEEANLTHVRDEAIHIATAAEHETLLAASGRSSHKKDTKHWRDAIVATDADFARVSALDHAATVPYAKTSRLEEAGARAARQADTEIAAAMKDVDRFSTAKEEAVATQAAFKAKRDVKGVEHLKAESKELKALARVQSKKMPKSLKSDKAKAKWQGKHDGDVKVIQDAITSRKVAYKAARTADEILYKGMGAEVSRLTAAGAKARKAHGAAKRAAKPVHAAYVPLKGARDTAEAGLASRAAQRIALQEKRLSQAIEFDLAQSASRLSSAKRNLGISSAAAKGWTKKATKARLALGRADSVVDASEAAIEAKRAAAQDGAKVAREVRIIAQGLRDSLSKVEKGDLDITLFKTELKRKRVTRAAVRNASEIENNQTVIDSAKLRKEFETIHGEGAVQKWFDDDLKDEGAKYLKEAMGDQNPGGKFTVADSTKIDLLYNALEGADNIVNTHKLMGEGWAMADAWLRATRDNMPGGNLNPMTWAKWASRPFDARLDKYGGVEVDARVADVADSHGSMMRQVGADVANIHDSYGGSSKAIEKTMAFLNNANGATVAIHGGKTLADGMRQVSMWQTFQELMRDHQRLMAADPSKTLADSPVWEHMANAWVGQGAAGMASKLEAKFSNPALLAIVTDETKDAWQAFEEMQDVVGRIEVTDARLGRTLGAFANTVANGASLHDMSRRMTTILGEITPEQAEAASKILSNEHRGAEYMAGLGVLQRMGVSHMSRLHNINVDSAAGMDMKILSLGLRTDGTQAFMPTNLINSFEESTRRISKERQPWHEHEGVIEKAKARARDFGHWYKTSVVGGWLVPDLSYSVANTGISDASQMFLTEGLLTTLRVSANTLPGMVPFYGALSNQSWFRMADRLQKKGRVRSVLGGVMNAFMNPKIDAVLRGKPGEWKIQGEIYDTARLQRMMQNERVWDTEAYMDVLSATETAVMNVAQRSGWANAKAYGKRWQRRITGHAQHVAQRQRTGLFLHLLEKGVDPVEAGNRVRTALFDWSDGVAKKEMEMNVLSSFFFYRYIKLSSKQAVNTLFEPLIKASDPDYFRKAMTGRSRIARTRQTYYAQSALSDWQINLDTPASQVEEDERERRELMRTFARHEYTDNRMSRVVEMGDEERKWWNDRSGQNDTHVEYVGPEASTLGSVELVLNMFSSFTTLGTMLLHEGLLGKGVASQKGAYWEDPAAEVGELFHPGAQTIARALMSENKGSRVTVQPEMETVIRGLGAFSQHLPILGRKYGENFGNVSVNPTTGKVEADTGAVLLINALPTLLQIPSAIRDMNNPAYSHSWMKGMMMTGLSATGVARPKTTSAAKQLGRYQRQSSAQSSDVLRAAKSRSKPK